MRMTYKTVSAEQIYPIMGTDGEIAISNKGAITVGYEITMPPVTTMVEEDYDAIIESFANAFRTLPAWTMVHRQDVYTKSGWTPQSARGGFLRQSYNRHFANREHLEHHSYLFITFGSRNLMEKNGTSSGLFGSRLNIEIPDANTYAVFLAKCSEVVAILSAGGQLSFRPLTDQDWAGSENEVGIIQRVMMLGEPSRTLSDVHLSADSVCAHQKRCVSYVIGESDELPSEISSVCAHERYSAGEYKLTTSLGARLGVMLDCEHIVNQYFLIPSQQEVLQRLDSNRRKMYAGASRSADNRINNEEIETYLDDVYKDGLFTVMTHLNVLTWAENDKDLLSSCGAISAALSAMGIQSKRNTFNTPILYYAAIPGNASELGRENLMLMELKSALCMSNYDSFERGIPGGNLDICDRFRHFPLQIDTQMLAEKHGFIGNYNQFILGPSGGGKSFYMNNYLYNCYLRGDHNFLIDRGDSYEGLTAIIREETNGIDGQYLSWDREHPISFSAFDGYQEWLSPDGGLNTDEPSVNCFLSILRTLWQPNGGWSADTDAILKQILVDFLLSIQSREEAHTPVMNDFFCFVDEQIVPKICYEPEEYDENDKHISRQAQNQAAQKHGYYLGSVRITQAIFDVTKFILSIKDYALGGSFSSLLNNPAPADLFQSRFTVFEVDRLSQGDRKFYSICIICIMNAFERKMRSTGGFKNLVIEEAWKAIANETMEPYLQSLWKTARKFNTAAIVVTQEVADILSSPVIKTAIIDNSDTKVLLDQSNHRNKFGEIASLLSLSQKERSLVMSINRANDSRYRYREVFIKLGAGYSGVFATEVSAQEAMVYESNKEKKKPLLDTAAKLNSWINAVQSLTKTK